MIRKRFFCIFFILSLSFISLLFHHRSADAYTESEPSDNFQIQEFLTEKQALALVFPECNEIITDEFFMTPEEKRSLEKSLSRRLYENGFRVYIGKQDGVIQGYAIITEEIGKFHPFTFIVGVKPNGKISEIAVLVYRESRGGDVAKKRFLYQFIGKSIKHPIRLNRDIINITGATMSVNCMCAGVRKVLAVINEYYLSGKRDPNRVAIAGPGRMAQKEERPIPGEKLGETSDAKTGRNQKQGGVSYGKKDDSSPEVKLFKQTRMIMGTFAEVSVYSGDEETAGRAVDAALNEMERLDRIMSNYKEDSELSLINKKAAQSPVPCNGDLLDVIEKSHYYSELSGGAFDITVSPVVALWGFFREKGNIPSDREIEDLLPAISYKNLVIEKSAGQGKPGSIFFKNDKTQIDLGAIGKGFAVDKALEVIKQYGIDNACINLGGNIYTLGSPAGRSIWKVGVQHPRKSGEILGYLRLRDEATATSGDYERFFEINGKRYSHIIDPRTGRPVNGVIASTVVAPTGTDVDALSTSIFVLGPKEGIALIKNIPGTDALIAYEGNGGKIMIYMTKGFKEKFRRVKNKGEDDNVRWYVVASGK
ncbi:MAG: FMN-binding protein [wastewater metagenome]|nr:FMN-binding protein [Candidatus Loosdrechtia aerotolerans]